MRRAMLLPPFAIYAAGCALPSQTPASALSYAPSPSLVTVDLPSRDVALSRWQLPPGDPWAPYAKYTLLSALGQNGETATLPDVSNFADVQRASLAGLRLAEAGLPPDTLWIVDMRGASSVAFGTAVSRYGRGSVSLVPTFNDWPGENEVIPAEETLAAMVTMSPHLPEADLATHPVFLLDAWRLAYRDEEPADDAYDNRYALTPSDLPDVPTLRDRGIRRVVYVVESHATTTLEEDDLHEAFVAYETAGLPVSMVDLDFLDLLDGPIAPPAWDDALGRWLLDIRPRVTILEQPGFYVRSRGGFGGVHAGPSVGMRGPGGGRGAGG